VLWKKFESEIEIITYCICRCELPKLKLLKFEVAPFIDLRVTSTDEDCLVEMISCKVFPLQDFTSVFFLLLLVEQQMEWNTHTHTHDEMH